MIYPVDSVIHLSNNLIVMFSACVINCSFCFLAGSLSNQVTMGGGRESNMKGTEMLVGNFKLLAPIPVRAWFKLYSSAKNIPLQKGLLNDS